MRKYLTKALLVLCCIMCYGTISNATATDKETKLTTINAPFVTISDISLDKQTVKKNQKLQYQFTLSFVDTFDYYNEDLNEGAFMDDNTSMYYAVVYWQSPKQQNIVRVYEWPVTKQTITIKDSILVKKGMQSGQWEISKIFIQNRSPESEDEGTTLAVKNGTEKEQLEKGDIDTYYTDLSVFDFTVTEKAGIRKTADAIFTLEGLDTPLVGFINKCSEIEGIANSLFTVQRGLGNSKGENTEGILYNNFFGTHLTGPVLVKNPHFLKYIAEKLTGKELSIEAFAYEQKGFEITLKNLKQ